LKISIDLNLDQIQGKTIVLADVSGSMRCPVSGNKSYGSIRTCYDISLLLGLLIRYKCDDC